jgi:hypothetical protein
MRNLLIHTGPNKKFSEEDEILARIQIDNSLELGWRPEDILLVTDFPYEYNGVRSIVVPDGLYYNFDLNANKVIVTLYLLNQGIIQKGELYWCHDFDAYENHPLDENVLGLTDFDIGLTHYTYKPEWQFASLFLKNTSKDIFELLEETVHLRTHASRNNEKNLTWLIKHNKIDSSRYKRLNVTYNFAKRYIETIYPLAIKPLRVLHFRPSDKDALMTHTALEMFMYGKNRLQIPLMTERLIRIFNYHGIR